MTPKTTTAIDLDALRLKIQQRFDYPKSIGCHASALGSGGGAWRQGYEAAIRDVLAIVDEQESACRA